MEDVGQQRRRLLPKAKAGRKGKRTMQHGKTAWKLCRKEERTTITATTNRAIKADKDTSIRKNLTLLRQ